ncbi:hypothetical protein C8J56DRAFT_1017505 [Mycena floridula]|nr:hypothetical protein C8J56DRAFT_1017505 [Mycena floridula]
MPVGQAGIFTARHLNSEKCSSVDGRCHFSQSTFASSPSPRVSALIGALDALVETGGAGTWPPSPSEYPTWPLVLQGYHHTYQQISADIPVLVSSLDDRENRKTIDAMRFKIDELLEEYVDCREVRRLLEEGDALFCEASKEAQAAWMGFGACISFLRHAYRWGVSPVVREAQRESSIAFPEGLDLPWIFVQRRFGITSPGGGLTTNVYFNPMRDGNETLVYSITEGLTEQHRATELWNTKLFVAMERLAFPMYQAICSATVALDQGDISASSGHLHTANESLKTDDKVSLDLWMPYAQGFHGWAYRGVDGISGGQALVIKSLDALLSITPWPSRDVEALHLSTPQIEWLEALRQYDIRRLVGRLGKTDGLDPTVQQLSAELDHMVNQLRVWRMGHLRRMELYEGVSRPERLHMTSGKSIADPGLVTDNKQMVEHLRGLLALRLGETR